MRWPLLLRQVAGKSMEPEIMAGQFIIASGLLPVRVGSIVVAKAEGREVIKRVLAIDSGQIVIEGDNTRYTKNYVIRKKDILGVRFI